MWRKETPLALLFPEGNYYSEGWERKEEKLNFAGKYKYM